MTETTHHDTTVQVRFMAHVLLLLRQLVRSAEENSSEAFVTEFRRLVSRFVSDEDFWSELRAYVDASCNGLSSLIRRVHPDLNESDLRLIELMACDFSYTEIAALLGLSRNSVTKKRTRIARKMRLDGTLRSLLASLKAAHDA